MRHTILVSCLMLLASCTSVVKRHTLQDVDISEARQSSNQSSISPRNEDEIRAAYAEYLKHASKHDISRIDALQRLAQLEFDLTARLEKNKGVHTDSTQTIADKIYDETLDRSITLLKTSLRDYPDSKDSDKILYQLAKAYDQKGSYEQSIATLDKLVKKYPHSEFYVESEFRLGEYAFSQKNYSRAEDIYTDVIVSRKNSQYLENALYKRGWARYKQEYYQEAIEDFLAAINLHDFPDFAQLDATQKSQFDEYFRAVGLSFSYLGGADSLNVYFKKHPDFRFIYHTYQHVSDIFLKQQRYSDAVDTLENFIKYQPASAQVPVASIRILDIWKQGGFVNKLLPSLSKYYVLYHPQSQYWSSHNSTREIYENVTSAIKDYIVVAATNYHREYESLHKQASFDNARLWYERYLRHYQGSSGKDNIHLLFAELLHKHKETAVALNQYELAAYDSGIILNKEAAYSTIILADELHSKATEAASKAVYLDKLIKYSLRYAQLYPGDSLTMKIITRASQEAYKSGDYAQTVKLSELYSSEKYTTETYNINVIKANSYFKLEQYEASEAAYNSILQHYRLDNKARVTLNDNLAISIYQQAKRADSNGNTDNALANYSRISDTVPSSPVAETGLYDAIALCMRANMWNQAIHYIKKFQATYPSSKLNHDVSKKLSVAYLKSHQDLAAANELVKIARTDQDSEYKAAALWKAGELYENKKDYASAIKSYREYAEHYRRPYAQYIESMYRLTALYKLSNNPRQANYWRKSILNSDKRTPNDLKTDRTILICSQTALQLAEEQNATYTSIRLTIPLKRSLETKKYHMQQAVNLYGQASSYGISSVATEATYSIGEIYRSFSKALLASERPRNLNKTELEQYNILLEDKAYPFEDKAIEFFAANLAHVKDGVFDDWIQKSYSKLKELYPARYSRDVKMEPYVNVLH